jgi:hypothetical protein
VELVLLKDFIPQELLVSLVPQALYHALQPQFLQLVQVLII